MWKWESQKDDKLSSILSYLDITGETGLASKDNFDSLTTYQKFFYNQVKSKIGVDAVYFLRDEEGVAKIPLIYFSMVDENDASKAAKLHCLSWNMWEARTARIEPQYKSSHVRTLDNHEITLHHLFFDFASS